MDVTNLDSAFLVAQGIQYPSIHYELIHNFTREYVELLKVTGFFGKQFGLDISNLDFKDGYSILAFDMSRNSDPNSNVGSAPMQGSVTINLRYNNPGLVSPMTYIFYMVRFTFKN